jgi:hypothetical protein
MEYAKPSSERHSFFYQVITAVFIDKPATYVIVIAREPGIVVLF